ncbi:MAG: hypothetical protein KME11_03870 [Timaviella obliquedivisa GSE-PSE-MK23-08B]|nr:hypothetical protein [Timaviella obliquedivisa GSE-PSE-MK23-08B]
MLRTAALFLPLVLSILLSLPTAAASCRTFNQHTVNQHTVCILDIQRSAKNYWQYRASISIDGITKPPEFYNCRDRNILQQDGTRIQFEPNSIGSFICRLYKPLPQSATPF